VLDIFTSAVSISRIYTASWGPDLSTAQNKHRAIYD